jgi:hypothetical protein
METASKPPQERSDDRWPRLLHVPESEIEKPNLKTLLKLIVNTVFRLFHDPVGIILGSAFVLIMLWGVHGKLTWLSVLWDGWKGPGSDPDARAQIIPGIPWDQEWISFFAGAFLLVVIPILLIKLVLKQDLKDYGLCLPPKERRTLAWLAAGVLFAVSLPAFFFGLRDAGMQATYPLFRDFTGVGQFLVYQLGYSVFFLVIEFTFRGYLLFGLFQFKDRDAPPGVVGVKGPLVFGYYAIFISMLSYTAWHLGKPLPELWGTLFWGITAGTIALESRSIIPVTLVHWVLNILLDLGIWQGWAS